MIRIQFTEKLLLHDFIIVSDDVHCDHVDVFGNLFVDHFTNTTGIGADSIEVDCVR